MKRLFIIPVLLAGLSVLGCSSADKKEDREVSMELLKGKTAQINTEVNELTEKVDNLSAEVSELNQRMKSVSEARREAVKLRTEIAGMDSGLAEMASRLERADMRKLSDLRIKVLSGNNSLPSAKKAASKLKKNGYTVKRVDMAPSANFSGNLVFYSKGMKSEAEAIAKLFGGNTRTKPLSWPSVFDIIFVTGKG